MEAKKCNPCHESFGSVASHEAHMQAHGYKRQVINAVVYWVPDISPRY